MLREQENQYTYHYKKQIKGSCEDVYDIMFQKIMSEFSDFDEKNNRNPIRKTELVGYQNTRCMFIIQLEDYQKNNFIEIVSKNATDTYTTRYQFEALDHDKSILHVFEKMESKYRRITMNYSLLSFFIKRGKKKKWKEIINMVELKLNDSW